MLATQRGLDVHITKTKGRSCELLVRMAKRKKEIAERNLRNSQLSRVKFKSLGSMGRVPIQRRKSGKRLTKENKEDIIKNYNYFRGDNNSKGMAVKKTADAFGCSPTTVRKVLKVTNTQRSVLHYRKRANIPPRGAQPGARYDRDEDQQARR